MNKEGTFADGYVAGYQSITGMNTIPSIPSYAIPAGKTPYEHGFAQGVKRAREWMGLPAEETQKSESK